MKIAVFKEQDALELRAAVSPECVKKYVALGASVAIEKGAGIKAGFMDEAFKKEGATIAASSTKAAEKADLVLKVGVPTADELKAIPASAALISTLNPFDTDAEIKAYNKAKLTTFAMELMPRITRAQSMDVLSSQSNLVGYKAVIDAAEVSGRAFPLMMTAAGTVAPAKVLVLGAGVAGLQAIATAKRLGAVVSAFDVRPEVKEQVESLGGTFVEVEAEESGAADGGYAKEMSTAYKKKQEAKIAEVIAGSDVVIATALIPGKKAPILVTEAHVKSMKEGAIVVDIAAARGGNCALTTPGKVVQKEGVHIIGHTNYPSRVAQDATQLYAKNLYNFIAAFYDKEADKFVVNQDDDIIKGALLTFDGNTVHEWFSGAKKPDSKPAANGNGTKKSDSKSSGKSSGKSSSNSTSKSKKKAA